jgi:anti-sigma B factor antagonist
MQEIRTFEQPGTPGAPSIEVRRPQQGVVQIVLLGEHDLASSAALERTIGDALPQAEHLVVDVTETEFIDSSTIGALLRSRNRAERAGVGFNLVVGPDSVVRRVLEVTDVLATLNSVDELEVALQPARASHNPSGPVEAP